MIEKFIHQLIGPSGVKILEWYVANSLYINGIIVGLAILYLVFPRQSRRIVGKIKEFWQKTPFALDEKDRQAVDKMKARLKGKKLEK